MEQDLAWPAHELCPPLLSQGLEVKRLGWQRRNRCEHLCIREYRDARVIPADSLPTPIDPDEQARLEQCIEGTVVRVFVVVSLESTRLTFERQAKH